MVLLLALKDGRVTDTRVNILFCRRRGDLERGAGSDSTGEGTRDGAIIPCSWAASDGGSGRCNCSPAQRAGPLPIKPVLVGQEGLLRWRRELVGGREHPLGYAVGKRGD